jgi:hypothetical protein
MSSLWVNSAHTWIEIKDMSYSYPIDVAIGSEIVKSEKTIDGKYASYVSESGGLELFMFASTTSGSSALDGRSFNRFKKV